MPWKTATPCACRETTPSSWSSQLRGKQVKIAHGLERSLEQLEGEDESFRRRVIDFLDGLVSHFELDDGRLVVAHAGMRERCQGRASSSPISFALWATPGETASRAPRVLYWALGSRASMVVFGHTPIPEPEWLNRTIYIDTGCVFGGRLTALRYPEKELVSVPARATYSEPVRPLSRPESPEKSGQQDHDDCSPSR